VVDRPLIQHVVDEAREAGIEHFIFVTGPQQGGDRGPLRPPVRAGDDLEGAQRGRPRPAVARPARPGTTSFTRQQSPLGLGHAVWCARELVGNEPFALLLPDVLVQHKPGCLAQMIEAYRPARAIEHHRGRGGAARPHPQYGVVGVGKAKGKLSPSPRWWRSRRARRRRPTSSSPAATSCSRRSSTLWRRRSGGAGGEIQITDAMIKLAKTQPFYGLKFEGRSFDCGSKIGFLSANVAYALERPDLAPAFRAEIKKLLG
jgi:UTP--glucose-1-phosphate uridylyltransferase